VGLREAEATMVAWAAARDGSEPRIEADGGEVTPEAVERILAHRHERVDGTGTPAGLVGDEIEMGARILAVTAAFEAGTAGRPDDEPARVRAVIEDLRTRAGREFDPMVVEALVLVGVEEGWLDHGWAQGPSDAADAA